MISEDNFLKLLKELDVQTKKGTSGRLKLFDMWLTQRYLKMRDEYRLETDDSKKVEFLIRYTDYVGNEHAVPRPRMRLR